jgi:diguanylate cyclase (GGDEF)-like protein
VIFPTNQQDLLFRLSEANLNASNDMTCRDSIMVIDTDHAAREITSRLLTDNGYEIQMFESRDVALERLRESLPGLVLLTICTSQPDAFDVLRAIRKQYTEPLLPVIVIADAAQSQADLTAFREGASDFLTRVCDNEVLLARIALRLQHRQAHQELQLSQERYALAAQGAQIGLWDLDIARQEIFLSSRWKELLGFAENELESTVPIWFDRMHHEDRDAFIELIGKSGGLDDDRFECELRMRHRDDSYRWMSCSGVVQLNADGKVHRLAGSLADVTEGKVRDVLTGLPNRLLFEEQLAKIINLDPQKHGLSAVLFLDLDDFKRVNDSYGHDAGDLLLCSVARRLENCLRGSDVVARQKSGWAVARHGGDEFTILLNQLHSRTDAEQIAERIIIALTEPFLIGAREVVIGVSIGIAFGGTDGKTSAEAIREADTAMYFAKTSGRGQYCIFDPEMQAGATAKLTLENDLRQAIRTHEFFLVYQPVVRLSSGRIEGFEALCRWKHPRGEKIGPDIFVPLIESLGLTSRLGRTIFEEACEQVLKWNDLAFGGPCISVTVNCSTEEFSQPSFKHDLLLTMTRVGIDPHTLRLEVNESALLGNPEQTRTAMNELRDLGIRIGIDDFGTGFSSLPFLHRIPLDQLKIDHSFVHKMLNCGETRDVVRTIINLAQNLDLNVVAEGVESAEQRDLLYAMGCTHAQGYFYSPPIPGIDVAEVIRRNGETPSIPRTIEIEDFEATRIETQLQNLDDLVRRQ